MMLGIILGGIVTNILLTILFYFVVTPIALILKLTHGHPLELGFRTKETSYWNYRDTKERGESDLEKQF